MTYLRNLNIGCEIQLSQELSFPGLLDFIAEEELRHKQGVVWMLFNQSIMAKNYKHIQTYKKNTKSLFLLKTKSKIRSK